MAYGLGRLRQATLRHLRRGRREVVWSPQRGLGFGNMLYAYLYAATERSRGRDCAVLLAPVMEPWLPHYPGLRALTVVRDQVGRWDRRDWTWRDHYGRDFARADLEGFIDAYLTEGLPEGDSSAVVVNVRRGDYYSEPHLRATYAFDIAGYLEVALGRMADAAPIPEIAFVSDGLEWCRTHLDALARERADVVSYLGGSPHESFVRVAGARRLVGTNSSFSYWGGYVGTHRFGGAAHVVMPRFHARLGDDWSAYQLDPGWDVVEEIPGGWDV